MVDYLPTYNPANRLIKESQQVTDFQLEAKRLVLKHYNARVEYKLDTLDIDDVYVVWFSKVLQNWKALVSTTVEDDMYYEVTHNGEKQETYLDAYKKIENVCIKDDIKEKPHSRACGYIPHPHGNLCSSNCPTCSGKSVIHH